MQNPRVPDNTTVTALLLLLVAATSDCQTALPATGKVLNLVCALQANHDGVEVDARQRATLITRLSSALDGLRRELE